MKTIVICALGLMLASTVPAWAEGTPLPKAKATATAPAAAAAPMPAAAAAPTPAAGAAPAPATGSASAKKKIDWAAMSKKQRGTYMKKTVVPAMQKVFAAFDAKKYKKINCVTCHGDGVNEAFAMPNPKLPALPTEPAGFKALQEKKPEAMTFMATKVKPAMAELLGKPESTQQNPEGFGCYACHSKDAAPAK